MKRHGQIGNRRRIPEHSPMHKALVDEPTDLIRRPLYYVAVERLRGVEPELDGKRRPPVTVVELRAIAAWVEEDIGQHLVWAVSAVVRTNSRETCQ